MRLSTLSALVLVDTAFGFLDTSPFFLFSTAPDFQLTSINKLQTSTVLTKEVYEALSQCPTERYILVEQSGVSTADYTDSKSAPNLARNLSLKKSSKIRSQFAAAELLDSPNTASWERVIEENCDAKVLHLDASTGAIPTIGSHNFLRVTLPAPSRSSRTSDLSNNDAYLASVLDLLPSEDYTVLYVTSPESSRDKSSVGGGKQDSRQYEMDAPLVDFMHNELKRDLSLHPRSNVTGNQTIIDGPLFEKYQFFSPGIFMGFSIGIPLLLLLYVAISAVSSLQVSYAAFDKESGPLAGKKGQ